ncbi:winged helix-turn-helix domain-containing protein [Streptomyces goshikiensis]
MLEDGVSYAEITQAETVRAALERGAQAHGSEAGLWTLERVGAVVERVTEVVLSGASVRRLLAGRLRWSVLRPGGGGRSGGTGRRSPAGSRASGRGSEKGGREPTCPDRVPRRIRRLPAASDPPRLRTPRLAPAATTPPPSPRSWSRGRRSTAASGWSWSGKSGTACPPMGAGPCALG